MVKISKIKVEEVSFQEKLKNLDKPENAKLKKALEHICFYNDEEPTKKELLRAGELLPKQSKFKVDFELTDAYTGLANAIRVGLVDEVVIDSLTVEDKDFHTTDRYILSDFFRKNVQLVPLRQNMTERLKSMKFSLEVVNATDEIIDVKSGDIQVKENGKIIPTGKVLVDNITIIELRPTKEIKIKKFEIISGKTHTNAAAFASISNIRYDILDMVPKGHTDEDPKGVSSMMHDPKHFSIGYTTHMNVDEPFWILKLCFRTLRDRLVKFQQELENVKKEKPLSHFSTDLEIESRGKLVMFKLNGEKHILPHMISQKCYLLDSNIPFVVPSISHPSIEIGIVSIIHKDPIAIVGDAISEIVKELDSLRDSLPKK